MLAKLIKWFGLSAAALLSLYWIYVIYARGELLWALAALVLVSTAFYVFLSRRAYTYRYLAPGLLGMAVFVVFPLLYTVQLGFTNYGSAHLLSFDRAKRYLLEETIRGEGPAMRFAIYSDGQAHRLVLEPSDGEGGDTAAAPAVTKWVTPAFVLEATAEAQDLTLTPLSAETFQPREALPMSQVIKHRSRLSKLSLVLPDGKRLSYAGVREFALQLRHYLAGAEGTLTDQQSGVVYTPDYHKGFFAAADGNYLEPGFKVTIGFDNYSRMVTDREFRGPFLAIFLWTVAFAGLTVLLTTVVGCTLAVLLNWDALRFRTLYRTLLFLPYAVPGFISILVFKGLFNSNFGEINAILNSLLGIRPQWFADAWLAKAMLLVVNLWLGYPYIMLVCTGLIKAIPGDLYEASALAGAGPLANFFNITGPLILKPLMPLLIASFAFNFNNFVLIALLTNGRPDFLNTRVPAGTTDILVSYTYRIAFQDSGQNFGLAGAISTVIFIMVAILSLANLKLTRVNRPEARS